MAHIDVVVDEAQIVIEEWARAEPKYTNRQIEKILQLLNEEYLFSLPLKSCYKKQNSPKGKRWLFYHHVALTLK